MRDSSALYCHANMCMCVFVFVGVSGGRLVNRFVNLRVSGFVFCVSGVSGFVGLASFVFFVYACVRLCGYVFVRFCVLVCV